MNSLLFNAEYLGRLENAKVNDNMRSVVSGLVASQRFSGLNRPERLVTYLAQISHESMGFRYDRELWNGKGAQARYDIRTDLGNTPERDGDGYKYRGRTAMQITGKYNTTEFHKWCVARFAGVPDFVANPDLMNTDPWEGLGPVWYWSTRNLNYWADKGDIVKVTRIINGGTNGLADRLRRYDRLALMFLDFAPNDIRGFQRSAKKHPQFVNLVVDGASGPQTRAALHFYLKELPTVTFVTYQTKPHQTTVTRPTIKGFWKNLWANFLTSWANKLNKG